MSKSSGGTKNPHAPLGRGVSVTYLSCDPSEQEQFTLTFLVFTSCVGTWRHYEKMTKDEVYLSFVKEHCLLFGSTWLTCERDQDPSMCTHLDRFYTTPMK